MSLYEVSSRRLRRAAFLCADATGFAGTLFLLLFTVLAAPDAAGFVPGITLPAETASELRAAGLEGVPASRAFRLPDLDDGQPHVFNLLVLLVEFPDARADRSANSPAEMYRRIFGTGTGGGTTGRTLADYYRENSHGRFELRGQVTRWVLVDSTTAYYSGGAGGVSIGAYPRNAQRLVEEALARVAGEMDATEFDNNGDGLVDGVLVIHAGTGVNESEPLGDAVNRNRILAHQFRTSAEVPLRGAAAFDYAIVDEQLRLGVVAHEFGHLLGLLDLYDTGVFSGSSGPFGVGDWSLMGTGALLNGGRNPSNLEAWSRQKLGFARVSRFNATDSFRSITLKSDSNEILRVWGAGGESEYFLLEARERKGLDQWLPGEGVLIYHVEETIQSNSGTRYKVAVVQADGRDDLGRFGGNRGDASDPYPSLFPANDEFSPTSTPPSRANAGGNSNVRIERIKPGGGGWTMDLDVGAPPRPVITKLVVRETEGNLDGIFSPGERGAVDVVIENRGRSIVQENLALAFAPKAPWVTMQKSVQAIGPLGRNESRSYSSAFAFRVAEDPPPPSVWFLTIFAFSECPLCPIVILEDSLLVSLGGGVGLSDSFDPPVAGWSSDSFSNTTFTTWALSSSRFRSGPSAWSIGSGSTSAYPNRLDAVLTSPPFRIPVGGQLLFHHSMEAESLSTGRAWDGGLIEIALDGGEWTDLVPAAGYPFRLEPGSGNALFGRGVYSGDTGGFRREALDLAPWGGQSARIRFRFASDAFTAPAGDQKQGGWVIDDVSIAVAPVRLSLQAVVTEENEVRLAGTFQGGGTVESLEITRRSTAPDARPVLVALLKDPLNDFEWTDGPPAGRYVYDARLLGGDGAGLTFSTSSVEITGIGAAPRLEVPWPTPYHASGPPLTLEYVLPPGSTGRSFQIDILDVQGRRVARLAEGSAVPGTFRTRWIGTSSSGELRGGLYWAQLRIEGFTPRTRRIVVVP